MAYYSTIFRQMLQISSRLEFQTLVKKHKGDYRVRTLSCWNQFIHMLFAQFGDRASLRDTIDSSYSHSQKLYHLGCTRVKRSTLSDANNKRSYKIYREFFYKLLDRTRRIAPQYKLKLPKQLYIMDTTIFVEIIGQYKEGNENGFFNLIVDDNKTYPISRINSLNDEYYINKTLQIKGFIVLPIRLPEEYLEYSREHVYFQGYIQLLSYEVIEDI